MYAGDFSYHTPSAEPEGDPGRTCLYDGEPWPCPVRVIVEQVTAKVLEIVQPTGAEPNCCDTCADRHAVRDGLVDEIKEL